MFVRKKINLQVDPMLARLIDHYAKKHRMPKTQWIRQVMIYSRGANWAGKLDPDSKGVRMVLVATSWPEGEFEKIAARARLRGTSAFPFIRQTLWTYIRKVERYVPSERTNLHQKRELIAAG